MRCPLGDQRLSGEITAETKGVTSAFISSSPGKNGKSSKFSCAFKALKCSSRADEGHNNSLEPFSIFSKNGYNPVGDESDGTRTNPRRGLSLPTPPFALNPEVPQRRHSEGYESDTSSSRLLELMGMETIDHDPFKDFEEDEDFWPGQGRGHGRRRGDAHLHPNRTLSDDTPDTPNASNRDPSNMVSSTVLVGKMVPDVDFDEFCQSNFNTPRMLHSKGSLGDSITPLVSPESQSDEFFQSNFNTPRMLHSKGSLGDSITPLVSPESQCDDSKAHNIHFRGSTSPFDTKTKHKLQLPNMNFGHDPVSRVPLLGYGSSTLFRLGETIPVQQIVPQDRSNMIPSQIPPSSEKVPPRMDPTTQISIQEKTVHENHLILNREEASSSSVSSFVEVLNQNTSHGHSKTTSHAAFFWRTHPITSISSYDLQQPKVSSRRAFRDMVVASDDLVSVHLGDAAHTWTKDKNPSFNQDVTREMWMTHQTFRWQVHMSSNAQAGYPRLHPQYQSSKRPAAALSFTSLASKNFAAVFASSDSTILQSRNHI